MTVLKWLFRIFIFLASLLLVGIIAILYLINKGEISSDKIKDSITQQIYEETGYRVYVDGGLHWQIFPVFNLQLQNLRVLGNTNISSKPIVKAKELHIGVALKPLLHQKVEVNDISLVEPQIYLLKNAAGNSNWTVVKPKSTKTMKIEQHKANQQADTKDIKKEHRSTNASSHSSKIKKLELNIEQVIIKNGQWITSDGDISKTTTIRNINLTLIPQLQKQIFKINGNLIAHNPQLKQEVPIDISATAKVNNKIIIIEPLVIKMLKGEINNRIVVDTKNAASLITINSKANHVDLAALQLLFKPEAKLSGNMAYQLNVRTAGNSNQLIKNANGQLDLEITNGNLNDVDLLSIAQTATYIFHRDPAIFKQKQEQNTNFASLTMKAPIKQGILIVEEMLMNSPLFDAKSTGTINLNNQQIDLNILAVLKQGVLNDKLQKIQQTVGGIPLRMTGTFSQYRILPDEQLILQAAAKYYIDKNKEKLQEQIDKNKQQLQEKIDEHTQKVREQVDKLQNKMQEKLQNQFDNLLNH